MSRQIMVGIHGDEAHDGGKEGQGATEVQSGSKAEDSGQAQ